MSVHSEEVNLLVYRYLLESGFTHSAFCFAHESLIARGVAGDGDIPPGALISALQKGLQYMEMEAHLNEPAPPIKRAPDVVSPAAASVGTSALVPAGSGAASGAEGASAGGVALPPQEISSSKVKLLKGHTSEVFVGAFNPRLDILATGSGDGTGRLWQLGDASGAGDTPYTVLQHVADASKAQDTRDVASIDWSPDGTRLATGCYDGRGRVWSAEGTLLSVLKGHTQPVFSIQWSPSGQALLTGSVDKSCIVWDAANGNILQQYAFHTAPILDVDWASDSQFATCSSDKTVQIVTIGDKSPTRVFTGHTDEVNAISWNPAKTLLASASDDGTARIWSLTASAKSGAVSTLASHKKAVYSVKWSPTGEGSANPTKPPMLATVSFDATVKLWDAAAGRVRHTLAKHTAMVYSAAFSPDGELLVSGSSDRNVFVWSTRDGSLLRTFTAPGGVFEVNFDSTGDRVVACCSNSTVAVIDLRV